MGNTVATVWDRPAKNDAETVAQQAIAALFECERVPISCGCIFARPSELPAAQRNDGMNVGITRLHRDQRSMLAWSVPLLTRQVLANYEFLTPGSE
jgi:hypothetical protein